MPVLLLTSRKRATVTLSPSYLIHASSSSELTRPPTPDRYQSKFGRLKLTEVRQQRGPLVPRHEPAVDDLAV